MCVCFVFFWQLRGFPNKITTKDELEDPMTRLIWHVTGQHTSVNYELIDFASFVPNNPPKTYQMTNSSNLPFNMDQALVASLTDLESARYNDSAISLFNLDPSQSDRSPGVSEMRRAV